MEFAQKLEIGHDFAEGLQSDEQLMELAKKLSLEEANKKVAPQSLPELKKQASDDAGLGGLFSEEAKHDLEVDKAEPVAKQEEPAKAEAPVEPKKEEFKLSRSVEELLPAVIVI